MAKIKNTGNQPRGFITEGGGHVVVPPGTEVDISLTEADHKYLTKLVADHDDPKPYEISGGPASDAKKAGKKDGDNGVAQSTEPPPGATSIVATPIDKKDDDDDKPKQAAPQPHRK